MRTCASCRQYVVGANGEVSKLKARGPAGSIIELPMLRKDAGVPPPCDVCPKIPDSAPARTWEHAVEFDPWFFDLRDEFLERRAVGGFGELDPLMLAAFARVDAAERRADAREVGRAAAESLARSLTRQR